MQDRGRISLARRGRLLLPYRHRRHLTCVQGASGLLRARQDQHLTYVHGAGGEGDVLVEGSRTALIHPHSSSTVILEIVLRL